VRKAGKGARSNLEEKRMKEATGEGDWRKGREDSRVLMTPTSLELAVTTLTRDKRIEEAKRRRDSIKYTQPAQYNHLTRLTPSQVMHE